MATKTKKADRSAAAKKAAKTRAENAEKRSQAAKKAARTRRKTRSRKRTVSQHPFEPGSEVTVHFDHDVQIERGLNREPFTKGEGSGKVAKDGTLEVSVEKPGTYALAGKAPNGEVRWIVAVVH